MASKSCCFPSTAQHPRSDWQPVFRFLDGVLEAVMNKKHHWSISFFCHHNVSKAITNHPLFGGFILRIYQPALGMVYYFFAKSGKSIAHMFIPQLFCHMFTIFLGGGLLRGKSTRFKRPSGNIAGQNHYL